MPTKPEFDRVNDLLAKADDFIAAKNLRHASEALGEAARIDPKDERIKQRWLVLQSAGNDDAGGGNVLEILRTYISTRTVKDGEEALQALRQRSLGEKDAIEALGMLLRVKAASTLPLLDSTVSTFLSQNLPARKAVATKLSKTATETFDLFFTFGPESFNTLTTIALETQLWTPSPSHQASAQQDLFRLNIAKLIAPGAENLDLALKALAKLLISAPETVTQDLDLDDFDAVLSCLDIRFPTPFRGQATLTAAKLLEATKTQGEEFFSQFINGRVAKQTNDDLVIAFSAAAVLFPVVPAVASKLFLTDGFIQRLVPNLERNSEDGVAGKRKSQNLEIAALELLSAACVDNKCREAVKRYCSSWLENLAEDPKGTHRALAAVVLAKLNAESSNDITTKLEQLVLSNDSQSEQAIEGLAYTTLQPSVKEEVASNAALLTHLVTTLQQSPATAAFGCLTIFTNLTAYRPPQSEEQKKVSQLKAYANAAPEAATEDPLDEPTRVTARCRKVLDANLVPVLLESSKTSNSVTNLALSTRILLNLAREQSHRTKMAQQGAVKLLLQIRNLAASRNQNTDTNTPGPEIAEILHNASHALARLLISLNPTHTFTSAFPASNAIPALAQLLIQDPNRESENETRDLLPVFEALLALTNLASLPDSTLRDQSARLTWPAIENHWLLSTNTLVQRAAVELVCNLLPSPSCAEKFVKDGSGREAQRLRILCALADAEDLATRLAAGGGLAVLTGWDIGVTAILELKSVAAKDEEGSGEGGSAGGIGALLRMCQDEDAGVRHRGLVCLGNVVNASRAVGERGRTSLKDAGAVEAVKGALKGTREAEVLEVGVGVLKALS